MARRSRFFNYYEPAVPRKVEDGIKTKSRRGSIGETWWSKRWVQVLESFNLGPRLTRGRSYARQGQVVSIEIEAGLVTAKVQGTRARPYTIKIRLKPLSARAWEKAVDAMAARAVYAAKLLSGEMPRDIEEAFHAAKTALFPSSSRQLMTECSCPDWANPCKHVAAVYYILAERFDEDPFLLFKLRGRTKEEIETALRERRAAVAGETPDSQEPAPQRSSRPLEQCLDCFWEAGAGLDDFSVAMEPDESGGALQLLGPFPAEQKNLDIDALLAAAYETVSERARRKALEDGAKNL